MGDKYTMTISRLTVDKLGVKLYDRVSAVIAETVANSYDADATKVTIRAPMGAPFGVCDRVEVIAAGGSLKEYHDEAGAKQTSYDPRRSLDELKR